MFLASLRKYFVTPPENKIVCPPQKQMTPALNTKGLVHVSSAVLILLQDSVHLVALNPQQSVNRQMGDIRAIFSKLGH